VILTECETCAAPLRRAGVGRPQRYCSTRCRVAAHRERRAMGAVPAEMRSADRWVRRGPGKVPLQPDGRPASVTDPATWSPHRVAAVRGELGFVLDGDGIVCLDLDHCLDAHGELAPWARRIVQACPSTYVEVSPSGTGLHIFGYGDVARGRRIRRGGEAIEVYGTGRYIAVTGQPYQDAPAELADITEVITSLQ
jgi:primase-polymerase (primpol)-like protein